ncbi:MULTISPECIES: CRISPR-associated endonuclease Cas1 [Salinibaculum]|uniref:CRISPR-associated endonuclease Cas1 n=1 Tax=Salinibaculum TaxID=2732368 RepID=UPI0030CB02FE
MSDARRGPDPRPPLEETVLYITTQGTQLGVNDNQYEIRDLSDTGEGEPSPNILEKFPVEKIETVNIFGRGVDLTSAVIAMASRTQTAINYFTTNGRFRGRFVPGETSVALLHEQQHHLSESDTHDVALRIVAGKVTNARRYLGRKGVEVPEDDGLATALTRLQAAETLNEIRGIEGAAAKSFFRHYEDTLADGWTMDGRSRRPPEDHVNSLLSLTYTMLEREAEAALRQVNLDPFVGIFHDMRHGRPALALDLMEEFRRGFADPFVARLINTETLTHDDFTVENELRDGAFDTYLSQFDQYLAEELTHDIVDRTLTRRETIRVQANLLRKRIIGDIPEYPPYETSR